MKYEYFVAYKHQKNGKGVVGHTTITLNTKIDGADALIEVTGKIAADAKIKTPVVITNFILLGVTE